MIRRLLALSVAMAASLISWSQVKVGDVAPDFVLTDINNESHHLYSYLDSGYTVIIDLSAAWCGPCWAGHTSHVFNDLVDHYGTTGNIAPGKVKVFFIEGERKNTIDQLRGIPSAAQKTQGDWVTGTKYPIIDTSAVNGLYLHQGYPSYTVICRDRMVAATVMGYTSDMDEAYWMRHVNNACPAYAPSASVDVKACHYNDADFFICKPAPVVRFQNYSSNLLTSATIRMYSGSTLLATQPWTGNLAPYGVAAVPVTPFSAGTFSNYRFEVTAPGDTHPANDQSPDSLFKLYNSKTARSVPVREDFELNTPNSYYYSTIAAYTYSWSPVIGLVDSVTGPNGTPSKAMSVNFSSLEYNTPAEFIWGSYNTSAVSNLSLDFDFAYYGRGSDYNAALEVLLSTDCGANWTSVAKKTGTSLTTIGPSDSVSLPSSATHWRHVSVPLANYRDSNLLIKVQASKSASVYGTGWLDNLSLNGTLDVATTIVAGDVNLAPNPARDEAVLAFDLQKAGRVCLEVVNVTGRIVTGSTRSAMQAGQQRLRISTAALAAGIYQVVLRTEDGIITRRLVVMR